MSQSTSMNTFYMIVWEGTIRNAITDKMCVNSNANGSKTFKVPESLTKHNLWQNCWTLDCSLLWTWSPHVFQHRLQHHRISQVQKDVLQPGSIIGCQNVMSKEVWITFPNFSPALNPQWSKKTCPFAIAGNLDLGGAATFLSDFDPKLMDFHLHFNAPSHETNRKEIDRSIKQQQTYTYTRLELFSTYSSSTAQGGGGSFKNRKPIGEIGCCESGMAERIRWWTERCLRSPLFLSLSLTIYLPTSLSSIYLSISLSLSLICLSV